MPLDGEKLLNRHFSLPFKEDGSCYQAKIIGVERNFQDPKHSSKDFMKFQIQVNDEEHDDEFRRRTLLTARPRLEDTGR